MNSIKKWGYLESKRWLSRYGKLKILDIRKWIKIMYKRKTYDKFFISSKSFLIEQLLTFDFNTEEECDKKLAELQKHREEAIADPVMHPFGWQSSYRKVKKRLPLNGLFRKKTQ